MTRNLKALGLALCAVFVFSAVAASSASAVDKFTTANGKPAWLHGVQVGTSEDNVFNTKSVNVPVTCEEATFFSTGTPASGAEKAEMHPEYKKCTSPLGAITVDTEGCDFVLTGITDEFINTENVKTGKNDATVSLQCEAEKSIIITGPLGAKITMTAAQNQNLLGVVYTNEAGPPSDVKVDVTVDKIHYSANFAAQVAGFTATDRDAYLTETVTVKGYEEDNTNKQVGISVS